MSSSFPNIEPSAFRKGEYVGYAAGAVWHVRKVNSRRWQAITSEPLQLPRDSKASFYISEGRTLQELSDGLARFNQRARA